MGTSPDLANNRVVFSVDFSPVVQQRSPTACRELGDCLFPRPRSHKCTLRSCEGRIRASADIAGAPASPELPFPLFSKAVEVLEELTSNYKVLNSHSSGQEPQVKVWLGFWGLANRKLRKWESYSSALTKVPDIRPAVGVLSTPVCFIPWQSLAFSSFTHLVLFTY